MRLGDLDALCEAMSNMAAEAFDDCEEHTIRGCLGVVQRMPTVDAVEVVRCKDCEHLYVINREDRYAHCPKTNTVFLPFKLDTRTHFCSCGERRGEE